jgi:type I restriction enzyme S subunit
MSRNGLPKGWTMALIRELVSLVNGRAFKPTDWKDSGLPIIRIQNLNDSDAPFNYCPDELPEKFRVFNGDLLFAWSGTPGTSFGAHIWRGEEAWLNQHIFKVVFDRKHLDERFLRLSINQNLDNYIRQAHGGAGLAHITKGMFEDSELAIAPLNEQRRIVAKIEELFSDLDAGVVALKRAKANLKRYRASVLKAAVEGKLTSEWRAKRPKTEPASKLLERILIERRRKWEADQLTKFAAAGKEPPKNWKAKYVEPTPPDTTDLPELPDGWCWATANQLCSQITDGEHIQPPYQEEGFPMLTATHVRQGHVEFKNVGYISESDFRRCLLRCAPTQGDVLIVSVGATTGRAGIVQDCPPFALVRSVLLLKPIMSGTYLLTWTQSPRCQAWITRASGASAQAHFYISDTKRMPVPLSPEAEQRQITTEVEERLSQITAAERQIDADLLRAARLRQSILKQAFEGKLVPQDPNDEPANVLLERIKVETPTGNGKPTAPKRKRTKQEAK